MKNRSARPLTLISAITVTLLTANTSWAACESNISRIPMAAPAARPAPAFRAAMLRQGPAPRAKATPRKPGPRAAIKTSARKIRPAAAAKAVHRQVRRTTPHRHVAKASPTRPAPTPVAVAARAIAQPAAFALISSTTCENGPGAGLLYSLRAPDLAPIPDVAQAAPAASVEDQPGVTFFPETSPSDGFGPMVAPPGVPPTGQPPVIGPPTEPQGPPTTLVPPTAPDFDKPPTVTPPTPPLGPPEQPPTGPPISPPGTPPGPTTLLPPTETPPRPPPVTPSAAPEPAAWMMLIAGFGLLGAQMRRRGRASAPRLP